MHFQFRQKVLGVSGECDVVEFHRVGGWKSGFTDIGGLYQIYPIEYKTRKSKNARI